MEEMFKIPMKVDIFVDGKKNMLPIVINIIPVGVLTEAYLYDDRLEQTIYLN